METWVIRIKWLRRAYMDTLPRKTFKNVEFFFGWYPLYRGCTRVNRRYMAAHGDIQASGPHSTQHGYSVYRGGSIFLETMCLGPNTLNPKAMSSIKPQQVKEEDPDDPPWSRGNNNNWARSEQG